MRLKILMLAPTPYFSDRGCHVRIYEEAQALRSLGHDVRIVTYHLGRDMPHIPTVRIPNIPWYSKLDAGPSLHKLYLDILLLFKAALVIPDFRPDVIHSHLHEGAFIGFFLKKVSGVPLLFDYQGSLTGECIDHGFFSASSIAARFFRWIEQWINRSADRIITSSSSGSSDLISAWGIKKVKVTPLIDGVNTEVFTPKPQNEARTLLGIPMNVPVVAYLGLMNRYQGTDLLLDVIEILKSKSVKVLFLIMGFPDERYRKEADARGLSDLIRFTGKVDYKDAPLMLTAADLAITPKLSLTEANGKIFNYMACGLPVVAFDTPVNREALGESGIYANYADSTDFAEKIQSMLSDPHKRQIHADQTRKRAVLEHSWTSRGKALVTTYQSLIQKQ
jgi:glycosyltransferase involved in cell wall biosynthesis